MKQLTFRVITDRNAAQSIWEEFSPHRVIDDEFDFRDMWTKELDFPFHFIVGYDGDTPVGLLALQQNTAKGLGAKLLQMDSPFLEFFGGIDTDDNDVFIKPGYEQFKEHFFEQITSPAVLTSLKEPYTINNHEAEFYLDRYYLEIDGFATFKEYIDHHFSGKRRRRILNELDEKRLKATTIEVKDGSEKDLDLLFTHSIARFKERSSFHIEQRRNVFRNLLKKFQYDIFLVLLDGEIKAVRYAIVYKNTYIGLNSAYDHTVSNLGKFLFTTSFKRAREHNCTIYDAGQGNNNWKDNLAIPKTPQYKLTLNISQ